MLMGAAEGKVPNSKRELLEYLKTESDISDGRKGN